MSEIDDLINDWAEKNNIEFPDSKDKLIDIQLGLLQDESYKGSALKAFL